MFFESEMISFNILDVVELKQKNTKAYNRQRNFSALSFRICSDTVIKTDTQSLYMTSGVISYIPARIDYRRISKTDELIAIHFDSSYYNSKNIESFLPENPEKFKHLFEKILNCWNSKEVGYKYKCSGIFYEILSLCYAQNYKPEPSDTKIKKSVDYILNHYHKSNLSISRVAAESFMSEVYFRKLFKAQYKISPQKYIISLRIQKARELISTGYYTLQEVALMSGYNDYKYFSTEFKKIVGVPPSEYAYKFN